MRRSAALGLHTPGATTLWDHRVSDVILAFHKAKGMARTTSMNLATWRRMSASSRLRPRYTRPYNHVEVDKTRQILMLVRNGRVRGTIHVSTGATGNTPLGNWNIYQRGGSYLYKFMAFVGNFGIHGYPSVPAYPASHGCVREPMWAAAWTYNNTTLGERVIIYR
jgi:hypothetical protein